MEQASKDNLQITKCMDIALKIIIMENLKNNCGLKIFK
jgi:hypothetical protein